jgi:uncharacterized membrane protein YkvA (DUF1232 family)
MRLLVEILSGLALVWLLLVAALLIASRRTGDPVTLREAARLVPDVVRLVRRLASDAALPRGVRWRLWLLLGYLLLPIDLVPDFLPVVGWADDAIIIALVLRSVVRTGGPGALEAHWPGTAQGLDVVRRLVGLGQPNG